MQRRSHAVAPLVLAGMFGALCFVALTHGGRDVRGHFEMKMGFERLARLSGLGIDEVHLSGHSFTQDSAIYDALDLDNVRSFFALDTADVRARVERLPWVSTADLRRAYPGRLEVRITERKPFAVWRRGDQETLIDRTGRVLAAINSGSVGDLPHVSGEGANTEVSALLALLDRFPGLKSRLETAERAGERRWTLHLSGAVTMHLPADREAPALESVATRIESLVSKPNRIIDLRAPGRIAIRDSSQPQITSAAPGLGILRHE